MILTLVPNPALDRVALAPGFAAGGDFRAARVIQYAGGKGFHFARALNTLGGRPMVVAPLGGEAGETVARLARAEGLACDAVPIQGETRTGLVVVNPENGEITTLYEAGPTLSGSEWAEVCRRCDFHLETAHLLTISGSLPQGAPPDVLLPLLSSARAAGVPVLLDTYGAVLAASLPGRPDVIKINQDEAAALVQQPVDTAEQALQAAGRIRQMGAQGVVITLGAQGAVGLDEQGEPFAWAAPAVESQFPVGSGDSFFAGLAFALDQEATLAAAARLGVAVGTANTLTLGPGVMDITQISALLAQVTALPGV